MLFIFFCSNEVLSYHLVEDGDLIRVFDDEGNQKCAYNKYKCRIIFSEDGKSFSVKRIEKRTINEISADIPCSADKPPAKIRKIDPESTNNSSVVISETQADEIEKDEASEILPKHQTNPFTTPIGQKTTQKKISDYFAQAKPISIPKYIEGFYPYPASDKPRKQRLSPYKQMLKKKEEKKSSIKSISPHALETRAVQADKIKLTSPKKIEEKDQDKTLLGMPIINPTLPLLASSEPIVTLDSFIDDDFEDEEFLKELDQIEKRALLELDQKKTSKQMSLAPPQIISHVEPVQTKSHCSIKHIKGFEAHKALLKKMMKSAHEQISISSESISFLDKDIFNLFRKLNNRGVEIRISYRKYIPSSVKKFFNEIKANLSQEQVHMKYLYVDGKCIIIGSHNWLDFRNESNDSSFKISQNNEYIRRLWARTYHKEFEYADGCLKPCRQFILELPHSSQLHFLTSLKLHEDFLRCMYKKANHEIKIYSPHVTFANAEKRLKDAASIIKEGVLIKVFVGSNNATDRLRRLVENDPDLSGKIEIFEDDDFHQKTLIVDNNLIAEGSFNWLSSSASEESDYHNFDATLVIQGPLAKQFIKKAMQ